MHAWIGLLSSAWHFSKNVLSVVPSTAFFFFCYLKLAIELTDTHIAHRLTHAFTPTKQDFLRALISKSAPNIKFPRLSNGSRNLKFVTKVGWVQRISRVWSLLLQFAFLLSMLACVRNLATWEYEPWSQFSLRDYKRLVWIAFAIWKYQRFSLSVKR